MSQSRLSIIGNSSGKYRSKLINGREHLVTSMVSLEGDSVMNGLFYPNEEVVKSYSQLNDIPAPAGHPTVDGKYVSASSVLAMNKHSFGAMVSNPRQEGMRFINDLVIDIEVANRTEEGREVIKRIKNREKIGVSTGLNASVTNASGKKNRRKYDGIVRQINFDHVAVLLNETPAGESTYTLNHGLIQSAIKRTKAMDDLNLDLSPLALEDKQLLSSMSAREIVNAIKAQPTVEDAKNIVLANGLFVNSASQNEVDDYINNKHAFQTYLDGLAEKRTEKCEFIIKNSQAWNQEQLNALDDDAIESVVNSITPKNNYSVNSRSSAAPVLELIKV